MPKLDKKNFLTGMKKLKFNYPNFELTEDRINLFYEFLCELTVEEYKFAIEKYIEENEFAPTIAGIRKKVESLKPVEKDLAREFESKLFVLDTDETIKYFKKQGDEIAVKVINNNYQLMRETTVQNIPIIKSQLREQYSAFLKRKKNEQIARDNNLQIDFNNFQLVEKNNKD